MVEDRANGPGVGTRLRRLGRHERPDRIGPGAWVSFDQPAESGVFRGAAVAEMDHRITPPPDSEPERRPPWAAGSPPEGRISESETSMSSM